MISYPRFYRDLTKQYRGRRENPLVMHHLLARPRRRNLLRHGLVLLPLLLFWLVQYRDFVLGGFPWENVLAQRGWLVVMGSLFVPFTFWLWRGSAMATERMTDLMLTRLTPWEMVFGQFWPIVRLQWILFGVGFLLPLAGLMLPAAILGGSTGEALGTSLRIAATGALWVLSTQVLLLSQQVPSGPRRSLLVAIVGSGLAPLILAVTGYLVSGNGAASVADRLLSIGIYLAGLTVIFWMAMWALEHRVRLMATEMESPPESSAALRRRIRKWRRSGDQAVPSVEELNPAAGKEAPLWLPAMIGGLAVTSAAFLIALFTGKNWDSNDLALEVTFHFAYPFIMGFVLGALLCPARHWADEELPALVASVQFRRHWPLHVIPLLAVFPFLLAIGHSLVVDLRNSSPTNVSGTITLHVVGLAFAFSVMYLIPSVLLFTIAQTSRLFPAFWHRAESAVVAMLFLLPHLLLLPRGTGIHRFIEPIVESQTYVLAICLWVSLRLVLADAGPKAVYIRRAYSKAPVPFLLPGRGNR